MTTRLNPFATAPASMQPMIDFANTVLKAGAKAGLEHNLMKLVEIRASQINGCAACLEMHTQEARSAGETEERIYLLDGWRESPFYSDRERAALGWTEALTRLSDSRHVPDEVYEPVRAHFTEDEQVQLTLLVAVINGFNRVNVGFGVSPLLKQRRAA